MKIVKILLGIIVVGGVIGAGVYFFLMRPTGFTTKEEVVQAFITDVKTDGACKKYFDSSTIDLCDIFVEALGTGTVTYVSSVTKGDDLRIVLKVGDTNVEFDVSFVTTKNSGLKAIFNKEYYLIEYIEW